jgi:hypothetical protein
MGDCGHTNAPVWQTTILGKLLSKRLDWIRRTSKQDHGATGIENFSRPKKKAGYNGARKVNRVHPSPLMRSPQIPSRRRQRRFLYSVYQWQYCEM